MMWLLLLLLMLLLLMLLLLQGGQRGGPVPFVGRGLPGQRHRLARLAQRLRVQHARPRQRRSAALLSLLAGLRRRLVVLQVRFFCSTLATTFHGTPLEKKNGTRNPSTASDWFSAGFSFCTQKKDDDVSERHDESDEARS